MKIPFIDAIVERRAAILEAELMATIEKHVRDRCTPATESAYDKYTYDVWSDGFTAFDFIGWLVDNAQNNIARRQADSVPTGSVWSKEDACWVGPKATSVTSLHHVECCPSSTTSKGDLCGQCRAVLVRMPGAEERRTQDLKVQPCSVCGKTGYYKYTGPTYTA